MYPTKKSQILNEIKSKLEEFNRTERNLSGLPNENAVNTLCRQIVDSIRRVNFVEHQLTAKHSPLRAAPESELFDPIKAAAIHKNNGNIDEAFWLIFLATHFGKSNKSEWLLCKDVYGALGQQNPWTWNRITQNLDEFEDWYRTASAVIMNDSTPRYFSNHRKYESIRFDANRSVPKVIRSYVEWIGVSHEAKLAEVAMESSANTPYELFDALYKRMRVVLSFGRTGKFDYLTMLGKLQIANIAPPKTYMKGATGPLRGANQLFIGTKSGLGADYLEEILFNLNEHLGLGNFGMQILEDSLCNWQKSPEEYVYFSG